jgi:thioredoxin 1
MSGHVRALDTPENLQVLLSESQADGKTVLLDFTAGWCAPCRGIKPVVHELAERYPDQFVVCEVDVDAAPTLQAHFEVRAMPTFIMIRENVVIFHQKGADEAALKQAVKLVASATHPQSTQN